MGSLVNTVFKVRRIFRQKTKTIFFLFCFYLTALDMTNGLSQVYYVKPEERINKFTKG